jgi:hypothetical protein
MIEVLGIKNAAKLVPVEDDMIPVDPVKENQNLLTGKPVKAFIEQNHEAHIQTHMAAINNPKIQQLMQMNPQAQMILAAAMAHINEHIALEYRRQVEETIGGPLPSEEQNKEISPEVADMIAVRAAQATTQITQRDTQEAKQKQNEQQMQDPVVQMQMQELQLKMKDLELKAQKQFSEAAAKADQLRIEEARIAAQKEIAAMQIAAKQETDGARIGVDAAKAQSQAQQAARAAFRQQPSKKERN